MADQKLTQLDLLSEAQHTDLMYLVVYDTDGLPVSVAIQVQDFLKYQILNVNRIISGQVVYTDSGLIFESVNLIYEINGFIYISHGDTTTLDANSSGNPRLDVIFADIDGIDNKTGTPAGSPAEPNLDNPESELKTNLVLVNDSATVPTSITITDVYLENAGQPNEYDATENTSGVRIDLANTTNPITDTKDITTIGTTQFQDTITFNHNDAVTIASFNNLKMTFKSLRDWRRGMITVAFYDGATYVGLSVIHSGTFDTSDTSSEQVVYIFTELVSWVDGETEFDTLKYIITDNNAGATRVRFQLDDITIQHGDTITVPDDTSHPHTGEITGMKGLTLDVTAITNRSIVTAVGADYVWVLDSTDGTLKRALISDIITAGGGIPILYNVKDYGALGDGVDYIDGALTAASATFTSASNPFVAGDVGKLIAVAGAGAGGNYHITTIASYTSAGEVELTDVGVTTVSGSAIWFFGTDDTTAIQDTIDAAFAAGGGIVYNPNGIYIVVGALQNNIGAENVDYNSQLYIPYSIYQVTTRTTIKILGETPPMLYQSNGIGAAKPTNTGVIWRSVLVGTGTKPCVLASNGDAGAPLSTYNYTGVEVENLQIQLTPITTSNKISMGGINFSTSGAISIVKKYTAFPYRIWLGDTLQPSVTISGLELPFVNCEHVGSAEYVELGGFTNGFVSGEHSYLSNCIAISCTNGFVQTANNHIALFNKISSFWCIYDFKVTGESHFKVEGLQIEWDSQGKWYDNVDTISDASHFGNGEITLNIVEAGVGVNNTKYSKVGGNEIRVKLISLINNIKTVPGTSYTFLIEDAQRVVETTNAGAIDLTVPPDATLNFDLGTIIIGIQSGAGQITIVAGGGVTVRTPETLLLNKQYSMFALIKIAANEWSLTGDLELV